MSTAQIFSTEPADCQPILPTIPISFFAHVGTNTPIRMLNHLRWPELVALLQGWARDTYDIKEDAPLLCPTIFVDAVRNASNSTDSAIVLIDSDDGAPLHEVIDFFRVNGFEAVVSSSARNRPTAPRWRLILPLSDVINKERYRETTEAITRLFQVVLSKDGVDRGKLASCTMFYVPGVYKRANRDGEEFTPDNQFHHIAGTIMASQDWISLADEINPKPPDPEPPDFDYEPSATTDEDVLAAIEATDNDLNDEDWQGYGAAICASLGVAAKRVFEEFTMRRVGGHGVSQAAVLRRVDSLWKDYCKGTSATVATIFYHVYKQNPDWEPPSRIQAREDYERRMSELTGKGPMHIPVNDNFFTQMGVEPPNSMEGKDEAASATDPFTDWTMNDESTGAANENTESAPKIYRFFDEYLDLPEIQYWDDDKLMPRLTGGYTIFVNGARGSNKTGVATIMTMDAVLKHGAKAVYIACEGRQFYGQVRMPAYCDAYNITVRDLRERFVFMDQGINLTELLKPGLTEKLIAGLSGFAPDIVIIDTYGAATPGVGWTDKMLGDILGPFGPIAKIRKAFDCIVLLVSHPPAGNERRVAGVDAQVNNTDELLLVSYDHKGTITVEVERYKDGQEGRKLYYQVDPNSVPVPRRIEAPIEEDEHNLGLQKRNLDRDLACQIRYNLAEAKFDNPDANFSSMELAKRITPLGDDYDWRWKSMMKKLENVIDRQVKGDEPSDFDDLAHNVSATKRASWRWYVDDDISTASGPSLDPSLRNRIVNGASLSDPSAIPQHGQKPSKTAIPH
jgi:hypothetical protein